jgi:hypothetical protein
MSGRRRRRRRQTHTHADWVAESMDEDELMMEAGRDLRPRPFTEDDASWRNPDMVDEVELRDSRPTEMDDFDLFESMT